MRADEGAHGADRELEDVDAGAALVVEAEEEIGGRRAAAFLVLFRFPPSPSARSGEELPSSAAAPLLAQATVSFSLSDSPSISAVVIASILVSAIPPWESEPEQESGLRSSRGKACSR